VADTVEFLSQEWLDLQCELLADLPARAGASGRLQHTVTGVPGGEVAYWLDFDDGRVVGGRLGSDPEPAVAITAPLAVAVDIASGNVEPSVAFMQGRAKVAGDQRMLLRLLALTATPEYRAAASRVEERTHH
jgi:hypothetical protein